MKKQEEKTKDIDILKHIRVYYKNEYRVLLGLYTIRKLHEGVPSLSIHR